jgi:hypothetical protein
MADFKLVKAVVKGLLTFVPGVNSLLEKRKSNSMHSCSDAEFCYSLWLRLLVYLKENGINASLKKIGEIGNGGSLGVGFCALLTGSHTYYSLQIDDKIRITRNQKLLEDIIHLFRNRTPISKKFSQINIPVNNYAFPEDLINNDFAEVMAQRIKLDLKNNFARSELIKIIDKWENAQSLGLDFIFSRAVMEHVSNPYKVYKSVRSHLNYSSYMLHDIELHSHDITDNPDGHYDISSLLWSVIYGKRSYFLNRWNLQKHMDTIRELNFTIIKTDKILYKSKENKAAIIYGACISASTI